MIRQTSERSRVVSGPMTEDSPYNPISKKGEIRAAIATQLLEESKRGNLKALVARCADFYGPKATNGVLNLLVIDKVKNNGMALICGNRNTKDSYTYTCDAAEGTALLGNTESAYGQVWHLPTDKNALTQIGYVDLCAKIVNTKAKSFAMGNLLMSFGGLFDRKLFEVVEMMYQNNNDYIFDSSKFETQFSFKPTTYFSGLSECLK